MERKVYGVYETEGQALRALDALVASGLDQDHVLLVTEGGFGQGLTQPADRKLWERFSQEITIRTLQPQEVREKKALEDYVQDLDSGRILVIIEEASEDEDLMEEGFYDEEDLEDDALEEVYSKRDTLFMDEGEDLDLLLKKEDLLLEVHELVPPAQEEGDWAPHEEKIVLYRDRVYAAGRPLDLDQGGEAK